jgi:ABC-type Mn2+/Zn2+ transport system ATPase subunit
MLRIGEPMLERIRYGGSCHIPAVPNTAALDVRNVSFAYHGMDTNVLDRVDLTVHPGERVALVGPNGAGKSTLLKLVLGLEQHEHGTIAVYGNPAHKCLHRVAIVPQRTTVDWRFPVTVRHVVTMGRYVHLGWFKRPSSEDHDRVNDALKLMEIEHLADRQIGELSGGQQQRVMLARTLAHDADLMLMDEPLNHVDFSTQELIFTPWNASPPPVKLLS